MAFIAETEFFAFRDKIKIDSFFGEIKKVHDAVTTAFSLVAVRIRDSSGPCFVAILG